MAKNNSKIISKLVPEHCLALQKMSTLKSNTKQGALFLAPPEIETALLDAFYKCKAD